ncbi:MAG: hypothetical protein M1827_004942 [Pycnora praestabilis]|nr:MAG: hypothetical protein M1827_004942 [Pycnora praestabilis]
MACDEDLINFDIIETQKENIQSLPGGRSARTLASLFSPSPIDKLSKSKVPDTRTISDTRNINDSIRQEFEQEIISISESDDPLDIYDRYVKWTLDAYPTAQATPQSQLLPLLERATKAFLSSSHYKNDPRYLKIWLHYVRLFSDSPRETFAFLARHNIGERLALFYEEFATWLEGAGRWTQAEEVYKMGVEREARPAERLLRKFGEFRHRFEQRPQVDDEPSSPALPTVRPALAAKIDPFATSTPRPADPQGTRNNHDPGSLASSRPGRQKLAIFSDADAPASDTKPAMGETAKGWESIGTMKDRKKENVSEARPWTGETLKTGTKKVGGAPKMMIFKDDSLSKISNEGTPPSANTLHQQEVVIPRTGKAERVFVNLEAVYPNPADPSEEMSFDELRAIHRGWLNKDWSRESQIHIQPEEKITEEERSFDETEPEDFVDAVITIKEQDNITIEEKIEVYKEAAAVKEGSREGRSSKPKKLKVMEIKDEPQTSRYPFRQVIQRVEDADFEVVKTNLESPTGPKIKRKNSAEPTMTFHTRAATDEIYSIFNQPLKAPAKEEESAEESSDDDDDYTSAGESTGTGMISGAVSEAGEETEVKSIEENDTEARSVSAWSDFKTSKHFPKNDNDDGIEESERQRPFEVLEDESRDSGASKYPEELVTPVSPGAEELPIRTRYIPIPPEDYEPPTRPYRDASQASQNRLPFMTPIVEKTESSLAPSTINAEKDYFNSKTPSRAKCDNTTPSIPEIDDDLWSSPFQEIVNEAVKENKKVQQLELVKPDRPNKTAYATKSHSSAREAVSMRDTLLKGPIIKDAQCNPMDDYTRNTIFKNLQPPLVSYDGYFELKDVTQGRSAEIRKFTKAIAKISKNSGDKTTTNLNIPPILRFPGADREYMVKRELGKGAFAPVYLVDKACTDDEDDKDNNVDQSAVMGKGKFGPNRKFLEAMKMEDPPTAWEFYIMRQAKSRLGVSRAADSIIHAYEMHIFADECYLIEEYRDQGTLLDLVNVAKVDAPAGGVMDEALVVFFTVELLRTVEVLHSNGILHGDLKADNCLIRFDALPSSEADWSSRYQRDGTGGWNAKGIALIDFGRGIDMGAFRPNVQFIADWKTGPQDCAEMREMRPWTYQVDYHGLAGIVHSMLFGRYIDTVVVDKGSSNLGAGATKTYRLKESFKRYWQQELWQGCFDLLLNPLAHLEAEEDGKMPLTRGLRGVREGMEEWLEENSERGAGLRNVIRRLERRCGGGRR